MNIWFAWNITLVIKILIDGNTYYINADLGKIKMIDLDDQNKKKTR